jgi:hypothetical protein
MVLIPMNLAEFSIELQGWAALLGPTPGNTAMGRNQSIHIAYSAALSDDA